MHVLAAVADRSRHSCTAPYLPRSGTKDKEPVYAAILLTRLFLWPTCFLQVGMIGQKAIIGQFARNWG
jgi:hypothetical protein